MIALGLVLLSGVILGCMAGTANTTPQPASTNYRFSRHDHCFTVLVDLAGTYHAVDLAKRFCAKPIGSGAWTLEDN